MKVQLRKYAAGAVAAGALAAVGAVALPLGSHDWQPVTYGLTESAQEILPATVTEAEPARVVSTTLDESGRPVVTVQEATNKADAAKIVEKAQKAKNAVGVEIDAPVKALGVPTGSDTYRSQQWDFTKMNVANAWQKSTGAGVTVAVIDTGVDANHPDLAANVLSGYDAIANTAGKSTDANGHGTHVAGTIAAVTGNNVGISAIAPDVKILPVKVLDAKGSGYMSDTAEGIIWAADNGAQVINMSLGSSAKVAAVTNAISYARSRGVTVVAAAGNSRASGSPTNYPAADEGVIGVAATDSADKVASYSNAGSYVDVAAPGSAILSTYPTALGNAYMNMNGTSMASPHVAAAAALLKAYNSALTPDQIQAALEKSAVDLGTAGKDTDFGYGRIDAAAALAAVTPATTAPTTAPATTAPATTAPTTTAPTTTAPTTTAPTTSAPTTSAPTTAPTTTPPTVAPTTKTPTTTPTTAPTSAPTTAPVTKSPTASPTPTPSKTVAKVTPVVTVGVSAREVSYGTSTVTTFTVKASGKAYAAKSVSVCLSEAGGAFSCTDTKTTTAGTLLVSRVATAAYQVYLTVPETETTTAVTSATASYTVRVKVAATRTAKGVMTVVLTGHAGQAVEVQQYVSGAWRTVGTYSATTAKAAVSGLVTGQKYRVVVADTTEILGTTSATVTA
ncbi:S8 family peptidase [Actinoplanes sp. CA-015351]|uniref:S8 family peptidase n=1 Tax=Actinoplanes sp. CA-015351 TaxID=3239897 RepID=UPI003D985231